MVDEGGSKNLTVALYAVALVRLDAGAEMGSLTVESDNGRPTSTTLYIDLNGGRPGDEDNLDVHGFLNENVYFITKKKQRVQLKSVRMPGKGKDDQCKMEGGRGTPLWRKKLIYVLKLHFLSCV